MSFICQFCERRLKSSSGLRQHINGSKPCLQKEKRSLGIFDVSSRLKKKPSPVVSISKRTYEENTDPYVGFQDTTPKSKRPRRFSDYDGQETGNIEKWNKVSQKTSLADGNIAIHTYSKIVATMNDKQIEALLEMLSPTSKLAAMEQKICRADPEVQPFAMDSSSEDELIIIGGEGEEEDAGPEKEAIPVNPDAVEQIAAPPPNPLAPPPYPLVPPLNPLHEDGPDYNHDRTINIDPDTEMRTKFAQYCREMSSIRPIFSVAEKRAIGLLGILKGAKAALSTYDAIMEWHHRDKGDINEREGLKHVCNVDVYLSRKKILKSLSDRYFLTDKKAKTVTIKLPNSKALVQLTFHNARDCIESLLTDPRVTDQDYLFHGNDPFAPPPEVKATSMIGELNTGQAYFAAYKKFIKFPGKQVLLPIIGYIDGAVTGQFSDLPITALKIALGIHTRLHRNKEIAWRTLGYVGQVSTAASRGKNILFESGHMEADTVRLEEDEGTHDITEDACKAQDFHTMLESLLFSYLEVQTNGFIWDLRYRGKTYRNIEFVPFIMFIKADTQEADLLCGSYTSRGKDVAQLCRNCTCPTMESDHVLAEYPKKTVKMIQDLVDAKNLKGLQRLSQQNIRNAFYKVRFSPYNRQGIHGSCPSEMLHALLLGIFSYTRDCFFDQIGRTSKLAASINGLAKQYGDFFQRQSERGGPKCHFKKGITKGKTTAKEFVGIMLIIAAILRSSEGRKLLSKRTESFGNPEFYADWVDLVEHLLEWEAFLNEPEMLGRHVIRLRMKNRYTMYLIKKVLNRTEGMGLNVIKFHMILHMWNDIWQFGVPSEFDTGSNEGHHKLTKIAAKLTQRNETTFDFQTCTRLDEFHLIELALAELFDGAVMWNYFNKVADLDEDKSIFDEEDNIPTTGGSQIRVAKNDKDDDVVYFMGVGKESKIPCELEWNKDLLLFLFELQSKLHINQLDIRVEHKRNGTIFRGHPNYREKQWKDWAIFDWGNEQLPGQIWCFVVIDFDPKVKDKKGNDVSVHHGAIKVERGTYAVIENATYDQRESETAISDLFVPILKEVVPNLEEVPGYNRKFYLVDVESIHDTVTIIPNLGGTTGNEYLIVKPRHEWVDMFKKWLDDPHNGDIIPLTEPKPRFNCLDNRTNK